MRLMMSTMLILIAAATGTAQITLKYGDYAALAGSLSTANYTAENTGPVSFDIGGTGAGQTWDLTGFTYTSEIVNSMFVPAAGTPYISQFPGASHATLAADADGELYVYLLLDQTGLYVLGIAGMAQGQPISWAYNPPRPEMQFPATLNSSWTYDGNPVDLGSGYSQQTRVETQIDGAGTLVVPGGSYECLRIRKTEWTTTKMVVGGQVLSENVSKSVAYTFMTQDGVTADIDADTLSPQTGTITAGEITYALFSNSTGLDNPAFAGDYALQAAYPNPVSAGAQSTVAWNLPAGGNVSVAVYDTRGREVGQVFEGRLNAGAHTHTVGTAGLAPGMYVVRMYVGGRVLTSPLAIIR